MYHNVSYSLFYGYAVSITTLSIQPQLYAKCSKLYDEMCSPKHCS